MSKQQIPIEKYDGPPAAADSVGILWQFHFTLRGGDTVIASYFGPWKTARDNAFAFARKHNTIQTLLSVPPCLSPRRRHDIPIEGSPKRPASWRQIPLWP